MAKIKILLLAILVLIMAVSATSLVACEFRDQYPEKPESKIITHNNKETPGRPVKDINETFEWELPPESFVGKVIEETTSYMIVEPNIDEEEYESFGDRITVKYINDHIDYLYGIGRRVVITYIPIINSDANPEIVTDDIRHDGFEKFTLSVQYKNDSIPARFAEIQWAGILTYVANNSEFDTYASDYNLYYYGLHDVYVTVDGDTLPLKEALTYGKVTLDGIIGECNRLSSLGIIEEHQYKDGGSSLYDFGDYKVIKYHTLDGDRDVYIGTSDMDINAKNAKNLCIGASLWKDWGVRLYAKDVTPDGLTIIFNQKGASVSGELQTGESFYLEKLSGNKWISVDTRAAIDYAFHCVAYMLKPNSETELKTEWKWLYDSLPEGQYRIAKEVTDFRDTGDYDKQLYYAYFVI